MSVKNLVYLSSEQALADLAFYIRSMNRKYALPKEVQWVTFGGSYPGSLSAWMRLKYPHLVHAAVSASGPLLAVADFSGKNIKLLNCCGYLKTKLGVCNLRSIEVPQVAFTYSGHANAIFIEQPVIYWCIFVVIYSRVHESCARFLGDPQPGMRDCSF